jgi:hypothetical protein
MECDRRRRAGAARHLDRSQRKRRVGTDDLRKDAEDLYVYDTNPANANEYKYRGGWEAMRVVTDSIP